MSRLAPATTKREAASMLGGVSEVDLYNAFRERGKGDADKLALRKGKAVNLVVARDLYVLDQIAERAESVFAGLRLQPPAGLKPTKHEPIDRIINLKISDTHFGANPDPNEVPLPYGPEQEARRFAKIMVETAEYKVQYRKETHLNIHLSGDIIQGQLHDLRDGIPMADQVIAAAQYIVQGIVYLAPKFPRGITVRCVTGNHGRRKDRHQGRATLQKYDSYETFVYKMVDFGTRHLPNVKVIIPKSPFYTYPLFDAVGFATHGDTVLNPGNPGTAINVKSIETQINKINAAFVAQGQKPCHVFSVGHVHVGSQVRLPGATLITNPCLIPPDAYSVSIGLFDNECGQTIWESVKGHPVGDLRIINVDESTDKDKSLEKIITPYVGF